MFARRFSVPKDLIFMEKTIYIRPTLLVVQRFSNFLVAGKMWLVVALVFAQGAVLAGGSCADQPVPGANKDLVLSAGDDFSVVIEEGRITASEDNAITLLPGTHVKRGEELAVSLVSKEYYEELARAAAEKKREQTVTSILAVSDDIPDITDVPLFFHALPGQSDPSAVMLRQQRANAVLTDLRTQRTQAAPVIILHRIIPSHQIHDQYVSSFRPVHDPDFSWGERAECIGVMLA